MIYFFIVLFVLLIVIAHSIYKRRNNATPQVKIKDIPRPPQPLDKKTRKDGRVTINYYKNGKFVKSCVCSFPPRSMTEKERVFYAIKPNLQFWVNSGDL